MTSPKMHPTGMVEVKSQVRMDGKLVVYGYGEDDRVINQGDLLIVTTNTVQDNLKNQKVEFALRIRGRDMELFVAAATDALHLWNKNADYLSQPTSRIVA